ncbi:MAG TPA: hypothetical protein VFA55_10040 [Candidatus Kapabacteria bacterium]|nr:hypothetical protein [Candidatus Kapabacteria bacterium]
MPKLFSLLLSLIAVSAFAQGLTPRRYCEPIKPNVRKVFHLIHTAAGKSDTTNFEWYTYGQLDSLDDGTGTILYSYQDRRPRVTLKGIYSVCDTALTYYPSRDQTEDSDAVYELRAPLEKDNLWQYQLTDPGMAKIIATGETVAVPAGTYKDCIVVRIGDGTTKYYAPDIGIVKTVTKDANFMDVTELVSVL